MTENQYIAELSANFALVNYTMGIIVKAISDREIVSVPKFDNDMCEFLIRSVNSLIKENNDLKAKSEE